MRLFVVDQTMTNAMFSIFYRLHISLNFSPYSTFPYIISLTYRS